MIRMSKAVRLILLFVAIGLIGYGIYFSLNSTNDSRVMEISKEEYCANLFDNSWSAWVDYATNAQSDKVQWEPPAKDSIISESEYFAEFRETNCRFTVNDWAYLTEDEKVVWDGIPWPELKTYPYEHLHPNTVMVLEAFPKSNPLKGDHYLAQIEYGQYQYLWDAINYGNVVIDIEQAEEFYKTFADKNAKFEMHMPDGSTHIWSMTYGEKPLQEDTHLVEAIVFASDIPGDAPNMPYVEIPQDMKPLILPLTERGKQFRYQTVSDAEATKIFEMLEKNGIMFTMDDEKLFLKYFGPLLKTN